MSNLQYKLRIFGIAILKTMQAANPPKTCVRNILCTQKKFYVHEIAAVDLSKIYFLKNAKKTCKPNDRNLNRDCIKILKLTQSEKSRKKL